MSFPIFPHREKWEKKYMEKEGKVFISGLFPYNFFPMGKNGEKWEKTQFSHGQK